MFTTPFQKNINDVLLADINRAMTAKYLGVQADDDRCLALEPEQVIFNPPATIVYWKDGTKTVVRCDNDEFSEEFGFAMACVRKIYGTRNCFKAQYKNALRPYLKKEKKPKVQETVPVQAESLHTKPQMLSLNQMLKAIADGDSVGVCIEVKD